MVDSILFSLKDSIDLLSLEIKKINNNNRIDNKQLLYKRIGDCLLWIYCILERVDQSSFPKKEQKLFNAFRGAANIQKHAKKDSDFDSFDSFINCSRFPMEFPFVFANNPVLTWKYFSENIIRRSDQVRDYNELLVDKDILETINEIYEILIKKCEV